MLIISQTFNRPGVARHCLQQLAGVLPAGVELHLWDDHSSEPVELTDVPHVAHREPERLGIHRLRALQLRFAIDQGAEWVYLTDSDALHDPDWWEVGRRLAEHAPIVSLYNTALHSHYGSAARPGEDWIVRRYAPGISYLMHRDNLLRLRPLIDRGLSNWDFSLPDALGNRCAVPVVSHVEHLGAGGIHSRPGDWERDRASNPTHYLKIARAQFLAAWSA